MIVADTDRGNLGYRRAAGDQAQEERNRVRGVGGEREAGLILNITSGASNRDSKWSILGAATPQST